MLADADRSAASNGISKPYANGKSHQRLPASGATNGAHKNSTLNGSSKTRQPDTYFGHNREEVTRILIQALSDMGYHSAAESVSQESGFELESPTVAAFRNAILEGDWNEAEMLLFGAVTPGDRTSEGGNGLVLADGADRNLMRFWIRQQKFLELLEQRETGRALSVLRTELTPLYQDTQKLHFLSSLLMCQKTEDLKSKAEWDGVCGESRHILLSQLSKCISPSVMLPEHRLATLLRQVKASQIGACLWHTSAASPSLYSDHVCDQRLFPTETVIELDEHDDQVWQVAFSHDGTKLASCGKGKQVIIWDVPSFKPIHFLGDHDHGVGNVAWSWDDKMLVTCCWDRHARLWDVNTGACLKKLERFQEPVTSCVWATDNQTFVTGALDKNHSLVQWNLDGEKVYDWSSTHRVEDLAISPDGHWLVASSAGNHIYVYNFVSRELEYQMDLQVRLTSITISQNSRHLLVNHNNGVAHLIDLVLREPVQSYAGFTGGQWMIRSSFGGANESFVISGSEDGSINIWHKASAHLVEKLSGHIPGCNAVAWSPTDPCLFASCGDDGKIKIWSNKNWRRARQETGRNSNSSSR
ncbi:WD40-repeat-containing domain protein [Hypoxylon cercidicola]|nr:WD40-repeat-containing domain protein [Hypoxylon cercidicola]